MDKEQRNKVIEESAKQLGVPSDVLKEGLGYVKKQREEYEKIYDLAQLIQQSINKHVEKLNRAQNVQESIVKKIAAQAVAYEQQLGKVIKLQKLYDAASTSLSNQRKKVEEIKTVSDDLASRYEEKNRLLAEANQEIAAYYALEDKIKKLQEQKNANEQAFNRLQERNIKYGQIREDLARRMERAILTGNQEEYNAIRKKQGLLNNLIAFNSDEMDEARERIGLLNTEIDSTKKLANAAKVGLEDKEAAATELLRERDILKQQIDIVQEKLRIESEILNEKQVGFNKISNELKNEKGILNAQKAALERTRDANAGRLAQLEKIIAREKEIIALLTKMKPIVKFVDRELESHSQEYGKIKEFIIDISKGGMTMYLAIVKASLDRWKELDKAVGEFRDKTGMLVTQTVKLYEATRAVNTELSHMGVGITEAYAAAGALTEQFQVIGLVTKDSIKNLSMMSANLGISVNDAAKFKGYFESISKNTGYTSEDMMKASAKLAEMGGVAPAAVMKDMAEASSETLMFLAKSPIQLMRATVEARRLGTTINSISKSARGFLNYQESINDELAASALLGKSISFQESRAAAFAGDVVKSRELALKQIAKAGDFTKLNVYQQEALAKAAGMTVEEIIKQQNQQKMLEALKNSGNAEDRRMFEEYESMNKRLQEDEKNAAKDLVARGREMAKQQLRQTEINKLVNSLKSIWTDITDALLGIASVIMPPIIFAFRFVAAIFKIISALVRGLLSPLTALGKLLGLGGKNAITIESAFAKLGDMVEWLVPKAEKLGEIIGWILLSFVGLWKTAGLLVKVFSGTKFGSWLSPIYQWMTRIMESLMKFPIKFATYFANVFRTIGGHIAYIGRAITSFGKGLGAVGSIFVNIGTKITFVGAKLMGIGRYILDIIQGTAKISDMFGKFGTVMSRVWNISTGWFSTLTKGAGVFSRIGQGIAYVWNLTTGWFGSIGKGVGIFSRIGQGFSAVFNIVRGVFSTIGNGVGIFSKIFGAVSKIGGVFGKLFSFVGVFSKIALPFMKFIPIVGWIIAGVQVLWELGKKLFSVWSDDNLSFGEKIIASIRAVPEAIFDALISPFIDVGVWILNLFGADISDGMVESIKNVGKKIFSYLTNPLLAAYDLFQYIFSFDGLLDGLESIGKAAIDALKSPFQFFFGWFEDDSGLSGKSPSKIGMMLVNGIKSIGSLLFDALANPFEMILNFVSSLFGGDGDLGTTIVEGIKGVTDFIYDLLVSPFKKLIGFAQKIPFIGKLFGGDDGAAEVSKSAQSEPIAQPTTTIETNSANNQISETQGRVTNAKARMASGEADETATTNTQVDVMGIKLDELITLLKDGAIGVNIDGVRVSKTLAKGS